MEKEKAVLSWQAPEFIYHTRGPVWFGIAAILVALMIAYAVKTDAVTMAVAFIVLTGVYLISHNRKPQIITFQITNLGLHAGPRLIPYNQIKAFWIIYNDKVRTLKLLTTEKFMTELTLQLGDQDPGEVRRELLREIPEYEGREEHFVDALIRIAKL